MKINKTPEPFPPHQVTIKAINNIVRPSPSRALQYIVECMKETKIIVNKHKTHSITITIYCADNLYELIKLNFVKDMGRDFLWKG